MSDRPACHIERLHVVTDGPVERSTAERTGGAFAGALHDALRVAHRGERTVHVGELTLRVPAHVLHDSAAVAGYARSVARQILDRGIDG